MYGALNVTVAKPNGVEIATHYAHTVEIGPEVVVVRLDDPDDEGSYAVDMGAAMYGREHTLTITANF